MNRKLRMGMVGGGRGAFIGGVHRMAANLDGKIELVAGCFSSDPEKSRLSGEDFFLDPSRVYTSYEEMAQKEAALPADKRIDFVSIVVRNNLHVPVATAFLKAGINVICDKPLALSLAEAKEFAEVVKKSGKVFALTHNYTGYPMVKEARAIVKSGKLGRLLKIVAEYPQGYAASAFKEAAPSKIANWRMDPNVSGVSNCIGDIGSHAENLARYITGLEIEELAAELTTFIPGRNLDDDGNILVRYEQGVKGILYASQVSSGDENNLNIRVYGTEGSIEWHQEHPNELIVKWLDKPRETWRRGNSYNGPEAAGVTRLPFGHPEAFIEAFANVYLGVAADIRAHSTGLKADPLTADYPRVEDGARGVRFIEKVVESALSERKWTTFT